MDTRFISNFPVSNIVALFIYFFLIGFYFTFKLTTMTFSNIFSYIVRVEVKSSLFLISIWNNLLTITEHCSKTPNCWKVVGDCENIFMFI